MNTLQRVANWHGAQAVKAYRARNIKAYLRHIRIADSLWMTARLWAAA